MDNQSCGVAKSKHVWQHPQLKQKYVAASLSTKEIDGA